MSTSKSQRLPPLNAIRAFEAAAKAGSLSKAGEALFVSPAAISQQVRILEEYLDIRLFERTRRGVELTSLGQVYLAYVHESFEKLRIGQQKVEQLNSQDTLLITAPPSVASKWLMPRMYKWMELNPDVEMRIDATYKPVNFNTSINDFSICFGDTTYAGLLKMEMFRDNVFPVCSPKLLSKSAEHNIANLLKEHPLIHIDWGDENIHLPSWENWLQHAGLQQTTASRGLQLNYSSMAIEAAIEGKGLMLGQMTMVQEELNSGKLIQISPISLPLNKSYYLTYPRRTLLKPMANEFLEWLTAECKFIL